MGLHIPFHGNVQHEANYTGRPATTWGTQVTGSATPHTLGSKAQLIASTAFDAYWVVVTIHSTSTVATNTNALVNIYRGASSAEQLLIPNLLAGWVQVPTSAFACRAFEFPLRVPRGTRLSADIQGIQASKTARVMIDLYGGGDSEWAGQKVECLGAVTGSSRGTLLTPGTTSEGSFVNLGASVSDFKYLLGMVQGTDTDTTSTNTTVALDAGVGGSVLTDLENLNVFNINTSEMSFPLASSRGRFCRIPAGTTVQGRLQALGAVTEPIDAAVYGVA